MSDEEDYDIWYVCKNCREAYPNKEDLALHRNIKHPKGVHRIPNQNSSVQFQFHSEIVNNNLRCHDDVGGIEDTTLTTPATATDIDIPGEWNETDFEKEMPVLEMECFQNGALVGDDDKIKLNSKSKPELPKEIQQETEKITALQLQGIKVQPESVEHVESNTIEIEPFFHTKNKHKRQKRMRIPSSRIKTRLIECSICETSSKSDQMIGCNSCTVYFHVTCASSASESGPILIQDELFCFDCAAEKDQDEHEDSHEVNALKNIKKRGKSRSQKIIEPKQPQVPIIKKSQHLPETTKKSSKVKKPIERQEKCEKYLFYQCKQCPKLFITKINAGKHYKHHYENEGHEHEQPTKPMNFCTAKVFTVNESDLSCPLCEHSFDQKLDQVIHIANHFEENQASVPENKEKSSSLQSAEIETVQKSGEHVQSSQTNSQDSNQQSWSQLNEHIMTNNKNQCVWCDKEFIQYDKLTDHMGIHTGEKSHQCKHCDRYFRFQSALSAHMKRCQLPK